MKNDLRILTLAEKKSLIAIEEPFAHLSDSAFYLVALATILKEIDPKAIEGIIPSKQMAIAC